MIKQYSGGCLNLFMRALLKDSQYFLNGNTEPLYAGNSKLETTINTYNLDNYKLYVEYNRQKLFIFYIEIYINNNELCYNIDGFVRCGYFEEKCNNCIYMEENKQCPLCHSSDVNILNKKCYNHPYEDNIICAEDAINNNNGIIRDDFELKLKSESSNRFIKSFNLLKEMNRRSKHPVFDNFIPSLLHYVKEKLNSQYPPEINSLILEYL